MATYAEGALTDPAQPCAGPTVPACFEYQTSMLGYRCRLVRVYS
jgi:hypothetical protein